MSATGEAGSTLIETLVVVAIISAVSLIAFPRLQGTLSAFALRQTVAMVEARLRQARADAISRDAPVVFVVAADGRGYGASGHPPTPAPPGVTVSGMIGTGMMGMGAAAGARSIAFFGDGSSSGGQVRIRSGRRVLAVAVAASDGAVGETPG